MMDHQKPVQPSLFYKFNLDQRVSADHPLRIIAGLIDFEFIYEEVEEFYGTVGKPSIPPPVILKLMFLLAYENVPSERQLLATLPLRLDWLWFLGMDLDSDIPDHSVLSKARTRWGTEAFRSFFQRVIHQANEAGLIDGRRIFCDGSLFDANASRKSAVSVGVVDLDAMSDELEQKLDGEQQSHDPAEEEPKAKVRVQRRSTTDPDAAVVTKPGAGPARPRYKAHRAVDDHSGVITATEVTPGDSDEGQHLEDLINQHEFNTDSEVVLVIADTQYGTTDNYLMCLDRAITPRIRLLADRNEARQKKAGLFRRNAFEYLEQENAYRCPAGELLHPKQKREERDAVRYGPDGDECVNCELRDRCTTSAARSITRHVRQSEIELALADLRTKPARADLKRRTHFMERSFAVAGRHGFKRCRWRELWRAEIHELLVATVQNVAVLARKRVRKPCATAAARVAVIANSFTPKARLARDATLTMLVPWRSSFSVS
jgi:transposase